MSGQGVSGGIPSGVHHISVTPFAEDESVDHDSLVDVVNAASDAGATGIVVLGIMSEGHKLTDRERSDVLRTTAQAARGRIAVVAGITAESTQVACRRAEDAADAGAGFVMLAPPRNCPVDSLVQHYASVAHASPLPVVVQDEPVTTGVRLSGRFFREVATIPGIVAAKIEEVPSPAKVTVIRDAAPDLASFGGLGGMSFFEELDRGAVGIMTGFAYPELLVQIQQAYSSGNREYARTLFYQYLPIIRFEAQLGVGGVTIRKQLLQERGIIRNSTVRKPAVAIDSGTHRELIELMEVLGLK